MDYEAHVLRGTHFVNGYTVLLNWSHDPQETEYKVAWDGLVFDQDRINRLVDRVKWSLDKDEPVIVAVFVPVKRN